MGKLRDYFILICIIFLSILFLSVSNFGVASLFFTFSSGIIGVLLLANTNDTSIPRKMVLWGEIALPVGLGYLGGISLFFVGTFISLLAWFIIEKTFVNNSTHVKAKAKRGIIRGCIQDKTPYFAGKGATVEIGGYILFDPMIYVVDKKDFPDYDASLLCLRRRVERPNASYLYRLPYWPRLSDLNPYQLGTYLEWLNSGKTNAGIEMGYVFLYFYGLERRTLIDRKDILDSCQEILRLLEIYDYSRSFRQYATGLIIHLLLLDILQAKTKLINKIIDVQEGRIDEKLEMLILGYLAKSQKPMPAKWALLLAKQDERSQNSVVLKRAYEEFEKLFTLRYECQLQKRIIPKLGERKNTVKYHAASPSLLYGSNIADAKWDSVIGWKRQFSPVVKLFNDCIEELKAYSRKIQNDAPGFSDSFEALPKELQEEIEHPQQQEWSDLLNNNIPSDNNIYLLKVCDIAALRNIAYRDKLTLGQSRTLANFVESLGSAIEPDVRYTNKSYLWNEKVAILRLPDEPIIPERQNYALVSILMPLAIEVSLASGAFEDEEKDVIVEFFQERFMLDSNESLRQEALMEYYLVNSVTFVGLKNKIVKNFNEKQRQAIGKFLVMIAGAADGICEEEVSSLEKTFKSLSLDITLVKEFIIELGFDSLSDAKLKVKGLQDSGGEIIPAKSVQSLDIDRIRKIKQESLEATEMLLKAMKTTEQGLIGDSQVSTTDDLPDSVLHDSSDYNADGVGLTISQHILPFYKAIIQRHEWDSFELIQLAREHKVTVSAAIDDINTWADENLGDFLIEDGDPVTVNLELLNNTGGNR